MSQTPNFDVSRYYQSPDENPHLEEDVMIAGGKVYKVWAPFSGHESAAVAYGREKTETPAFNPLEMEAYLAGGAVVKDTVSLAAGRVEAELAAGNLAIAS